MRGVYKPQLMSRSEAEKFFKRKASPDADLTSKEFLKKKVNAMVMSKPVGKVLDSKVGKSGVAVGNAVIKAAKWPGKQIEKEMRMDKEKDDKYRMEGKMMNKNFSGPSKFNYGVQIKKNK